jgi:hypothetical protein
MRNPLHFFRKPARETPLHTIALQRMGADDSFTQWSSQYANLQVVWNKCDRSYWLMWLVSNAPKHPKNTEQALVKCACAVTRLVLPHDPGGEDMALKALETVEAWLEGKATQEELWTVAKAAIDGWGAMLPNPYAYAYSAAAATAAAAASAAGGSTVADHVEEAVHAAERATGYCDSYIFRDAALIAKQPAIVKIIRQFLVCPEIKV